MARMTKTCSTPRIYGENDEDMLDASDMTKTAT